MSLDAAEMVSVRRAELDALRAEVRRMRREVGRALAVGRIQADSGPGDDAPTFTRKQRTVPDVKDQYDDSVVVDLVQNAPVASTDAPCA